MKQIPEREDGTFRRVVSRVKVEMKPSRIAVGAIVAVILLALLLS